MSILEVEVTHRLDAAGSWRARLPLTDPRTSTAQVGKNFWDIREGEGLVFAGLIENVQKTPEGDLELGGPTLLEELLYRNTLLNRQYDNQTVNVVVDALLALAPGWSRSGSSTSTVTARFDGESVLKALLLVTGQRGLHLREKTTEAAGVLTRQVEIGAFGVSSGVTLMGGFPHEEVLDDATYAAVESLSVEETSEEVWNWVIPVGAGEGTSQLTLEFSTRTTPYAIQNMVGPDGRTIYYLKDAASITTYGQRERAFVAKDIAPLSNTKAALQAAANALYDLAVAQLGWWKQKQTAYRLTARGLATGVKPGDKIRLRWRGFAQHWGEKYVYLNVDAELFVLERTRRFETDGSETSELVVSDLDRMLQTSDEVIIGKLEETARAFRTHVQASVSNRSAGPVLEELQSGSPMNFDVFIDDNVTQLLRCKLRLKPRAIRSTAAGAAAGGGQTASAEASHTHNVTGQTASAGGGQTSTAAGAHRHEVGQMAKVGDNVSVGSTCDRDSLYFYGSGGQSIGQADFFTAIASTIPASVTIFYTKSEQAAHPHDVINHTHPVTATASAAGSSHSHTVSDHTHGQVYGIYEGTTATGMTLKINGVDRTAALGGPWNAAVTLDITAYLLDTDGVVVQGIHAIEVGSTVLGRVEAWVDLTEAVQSIIAV